jgi:hypothetical protein
VISARQREIVGRATWAIADSGLQVAAQATLPAALPAGGFYVPPTLVATCPAHRMAQEEIFGPVQAVIPFDGEARPCGDRQRHALRAGGRRVDARRRRQLRMARLQLRARSSSTTTAPAAASSCRSAASSISGHGREKGFEALYGFSDRLAEDGQGRIEAARHGAAGGTRRLRGIRGSFEGVHAPVATARGRSGNGSDVGQRGGRVRGARPCGTGTERPAGCAAWSVPG